MPREFGYIYVLEGEHGYFKIGKSIHPEQRREQIGIKLPFELETKFLFQCLIENMDKAERLLHERFRSKRVRGEWFLLESEDLQWFKNNPLELPIIVAHSFCMETECYYEGLKRTCEHQDAMVPCPS